MRDDFDAAVKAYERATRATSGRLVDYLRAVLPDVVWTPYSRVTYRAHPCARAWIAEMREWLYINVTRGDAANPTDDPDRVLIRADLGACGVDGSAPTLAGALTGLCMALSNADIAPREAHVLHALLDKLTEAEASPDTTKVDVSNPQR